MRGDQLTQREQQVLLGLADGLTLEYIATELYLSLHTVKTYAKSLREKLGARTAAHAVALAYHEGILVPKGARR